MSQESTATLSPRHLTHPTGAPEEAQPTLEGTGRRRQSKPAAGGPKPPLEPWRLVAGLVLLAIAGAFVSIPLATMVVNSNRLTGVIETHDEQVQGMNQAEVRQAWKAAQEYNQELAVRGQKVLGEAEDPFTAGEGSLSSKDTLYNSLLEPPGDGVMSQISYPSLGINLPVRHGTSDEVLSDGAGHLYGTSLPVGGPNTHAVFAAHSGLASRVLFDRLSMKQAKVGDKFAIITLGHTLHYQVTSITVVQPDDFSGFAIQPGKDLVTLLTCTPYAVNTERLLVTGTRVPAEDPPVDLPEKGMSSTSKILLGVMAAVWLTFLAVALWAVRRQQRRVAEAAAGTLPAPVAGRAHDSRRRSLRPLRTAPTAVAGLGDPGRAEPGHGDPGRGEPPEALEEPAGERANADNTREMTNENGKDTRNES